MRAALNFALNFFFRQTRKDYLGVAHTCSSRLFVHKSRPSCFYFLSEMSLVHSRVLAPAEKSDTCDLDASVHLSLKSIYSYNYRFYWLILMGYLKCSLFIAIARTELTKVNSFYLKGIDFLNKKRNQVKKPLSFIGIMTGMFFVLFNFVLRSLIFHCWTVR